MSLLFNGSTQYAKASNPVNIRDGFTISFWINFSSFFWANNALIGNVNRPNNTGWFIFYKRDTTPDQIRFQAGDGATWCFLNVWWDTPWNVGEEHHVVLTRSANILLMYDNGVLNTDKTDTATSFNLVGAGTNLEIGKQANSTNHTNARIWDCRIYDGKVFTATEAKIQYESRGNDGITSYLAYRALLDEKSEGRAATGANTLIDISGNGYHGTPFNSPTYKAEAVRM